MYIIKIISTARFYVLLMSRPKPTVAHDVRRRISLAGAHLTVMTDQPQRGPPPKSRWGKSKAGAEEWMAEESLARRFFLSIPCSSFDYFFDPVFMTASAWFPAERWRQKIKGASFESRPASPVHAVGFKAFAAMFRAVERCSKNEMRTLARAGHFILAILSILISSPWHEIDHSSERLDAKNRRLPDQGRGSGE
jgi:hypothetical protein